MVGGGTPKSFVERCRRSVAPFWVLALLAGRKLKLAATTAKSLARLLVLAALASGGLGGTALAALQFDVFIGYDGTVHEASWFPVVCEVLNDGPGFKGVFELTGAQLNQSHIRRMAIELPTGTRKRFVMPVFMPGRFNPVWNADLYDERGRKRAELLNLQPRKRVYWESPLLGALPRNIGGLPDFPPVHQNRRDMQPGIARLQKELFPDNPIALQGLNAIYLNSERADLSVPQVNALLAWLHDGGHLIVGVEQPSDINANPWLRALLPCDLTGVSAVSAQQELQVWVRNAPMKASSSRSAERPPPTRSGASSRQRSSATTPPPTPPSNPFANQQADPAFEQAQLVVATGALRDGQALVSSQETPLIVAAQRGRGKITVLTFSPEREPFRSWKNRSWFWARLAELPAGWFISTDFARYGGWSIDGVFGSMIDSKQVRKLPVGWLLVLLLVYLLVIGPVDQFWLKRIGRQMLTWVTFPAYVVLFSGLIYWIGFMLRAGETEWNELHLVDVLPRGEAAEFHGRTYGSIYSPSNARYDLVSTNAYAALRGEFMGYYSAQSESSRATVEQQGNHFAARVSVPVWTIEMFVSDWWHSEQQPPVRLTIVPQGTRWQVTAESRLKHRLGPVALVLGGRVHELGNFAPGQTREFTLNAGQGLFLRDFVRNHGGQFQGLMQQRQRALGDNRAGLPDTPHSAMAASFISLWNEDQQNNYWNFVATPGVDLTDLTERGDAVLLAWAPGYAPVPPLNRFSPRRSRRDTLLRLAFPLKKSPTL